MTRQRRANLWRIGLGILAVVALTALHIQLDLRQRAAIARRRRQTRHIIHSLLEAIRNE